MLPEGFEALRGTRRAMLGSMVQSHKDVVPVSIFDEADIHQWNPLTDITVRLIQAIAHACKIEPSLNAWFDTDYQLANALKRFIWAWLWTLLRDSLFPLFTMLPITRQRSCDTSLNDYKTAVGLRATLLRNN